MNTSSSIPNFDLLVAQARKGAAKAANQTADTPEFHEIADFIGESLESGQTEGLKALEHRLRAEDRNALAWYLHLLRTLSGTVRTEEEVRHLIFIPLFATPTIQGPLQLTSIAHEIAGSLEHALDLGHGTLKLREQGCSLSELESLSALQWRGLTLGEGDLPYSNGPFGDCGALLGLWSVPLYDQPRLKRKLVHAMQRTPALNQWKMRTEALLEEAAGGAQVRLFPVLQLQDLFQGLRQIRLNLKLEADRRQHADAKVLRWHWEEAIGRLAWRFEGAKLDAPELSADFPDEPAVLVEAQLARLSQRLALKLNPALPYRHP